MCLEASLLHLLVTFNLFREVFIEEGDIEVIRVISLRDLLWVIWHELHDDFIRSERSDAVHDWLALCVVAYLNIDHFLWDVSDHTSSYDWSIVPNDY